MKINIDNLNIRSVLTSGACFRQIEEKDGSFTIILNDRVVNINQQDNELIIDSSNNDNIENIIINYFDLNRDYEYINNKIISYDHKMEKVINECKGYRILSQDSFEMCISYIISQNNNVKRISKSINELCECYGDKVDFNNKEYYLFPKYEKLKSLTCEDYRRFGVGFRDKYLVDFIMKYKNMKDINTLSTIEAIEELIKIKGIGMKVASCILLFGYSRLDVFPIDTWVKKYIKENYNIKDTQKDIEKFTKETFKEYSGLVIQYMYHSNRNN